MGVVEASLDAERGTELSGFPGHTPSLELAQAAELFLNFAQERTGEGLERSYEPPVVNGAALIDQHLAVLPISGDPAREGNPEKILSREAGGARHHPGGGCPASFNRSVWITSTGRTLPGSVPRRGLRSAR